MTGPRVIAGSAKGRRLYMVPGKGTRPIGDRQKESLFNIIGRDIEGAMFLDLFAGTGSVGIEALSRGAAKAVFFDTSRQAIKTIKANLDMTGLSERGETYQVNSLSSLKAPASEGFDYIYIAPPQYHGVWEEALLAVDQSEGWCNPDAWVVVQIHPDEYKDLELKNLTHFDSRKYGKTLLVFYYLSGE